jgi:membrane protease YdiL (CAAX protease family)
MATTPRWLLGLAEAGIVLVVYGPLGLLGYWFARRLKLPAVFVEGAGWRRWLLWPGVLGIGLGSLLVVLDRAFVAAGSPMIMAHPAFPFSVIASAAAAIGEEVLFRSFAFGLWAFLLNLLLRRWKVGPAALWGGVLIAALLFGAGHLPAAMLFSGAASPLQMPALAVGEVFLLNGALGLVAGERYLRDGLVAAIGVHFWTDVVWHVIWPLLAAAF